MTEKLNDERWTSAWPDLLAFAGWLGIAWWGRWQAGDLVWSLWLSSLVVGYSMILWAMIRPVVDFAGAVAQDRTMSFSLNGNDLPKLLLFGGIALFAALFILAFFTIHFGGFHYVHSQLLAMFFPIDIGGTGRTNASGWSMYAEVARRYWIFLPSAFLAERAVFMRREPPAEIRPSVTAEAIAERKKRNLLRKPGLMMEPYRNVMLMHALIFFFALAHFAKLENFAVYAVVYAVYFFPWRLVQSDVKVTAPV